MNARTGELAYPTTAPAGWLTRLARDRLFRSLAALAHGELQLVERDGTQRFGARGDSARLVARVEVRDDHFYRALLSGGSIGAAESWVRGEWDSPDLLAVIRLMAANIDLLNGIDDSASPLARLALRALHAFNANSRSGSKRNIAAHYDLGNDLFAEFLDPTMMYSAAIFPRAGATLEEASLAKLDRICRKLELTPDDHLLEIGTGWGGMAEYAARQYGCRVTTTTISREQYTFARERIAAAGLEHRVTVLMSDYRDLEGSYDKLVSIEMVEAVGERFLPRYFAHCSRLLKPHGLMLLQSILMPDQRQARARQNVDFIQRYIFPGGFLPSSAAITRLIGSETDMQLLDYHDITLDYARTLAAWRERFHANAARIREHGYDEAFMRLWEFYLCYCEGGFRERVTGTAQFLFAKPGYRAPQDA